MQLLNKFWFSTKKTLGNKVEETPYEGNISHLHQEKTENQMATANEEISVGTALIKEIFNESLAKSPVHFASEHIVFTSSCLQAGVLFW